MSFLQDEVLVHSVCCFTEKFDNSLMWSHYADNHKGICLIYNFKNDLKIKDKLFQVEYKEEYPVLDNFFDHNALLRKSPEWEYEKEWRIVKMESGEVKINNKVLAGVIFGCEADELEKNKIIDACNSLNNKEFLFYQMIKLKSKYGLLRKELSL